jgi:hypothetical protein
MGENDSHDRQDGKIKTEKKEENTEMDKKEGNQKGEMKQVDIGVEYEVREDFLKEEEKGYG